MQFSNNDREILSNDKNQQFINNCLNEFKDQPISIENRRKVQNLIIWSYLPNLISISTATFFIFYLLDSYSVYIKIGLSIILFLIAASLEVGKRSLIAEAAKTYFKFSKINYFMVFGVCLLITISMAASYQGGNKLIVETVSE